MTFKSNLTIDDIARELGVSKTTISRAISGKGRISTATRERVLEYIELHNYRPNAAAKGLAESRTYNLALVLPRDFITLDLPFFRRSMSAICEEAHLNDYNVMVCLSGDNDHASLTRTLDYRKVDGVILTRTVENDALLDILTSRGVAFATLGSLPAKSRGSALIEADHDQIGGCHAFTKLFLERSREKCALLGNDLNYVVNQSRLSGFRQACQELNMTLDMTPIRMGINDQESCSMVVNELLDAGIRRFVCMDEDICIRTFRAVQARNLSVPEEVELVSLSDSEILAKNQPPISALDFDPAELGRVACRELLKALREEPFDARPLVGYQIQNRNSVR